ncbi:MAG: M20/M25/M40 family metallo-hydrolase [Sandaracinaceae bacterium]|nr:M20/M25/M40 family metallo-hydrolase [Sandaracinaceae bacterium]
MTTTADQVAARAKERFDETVARLTEYLRYPAISCEPEHARDVKALAERIVDDLGALGMSHCRTLELDDALPCVAAERMNAPGKPTVLVYGHLDLQPVRDEPWDSPPHEAQAVDGRLYGRGSADDMGGWVSHLAAMEAWLAVAGELPVNLRLLIEGEEEIGSPNLLRYMEAYPEAFEADVMILTDCENPSTDIPGLTVSLRGLMDLELRCESMAADVHSGLWGNAIPDPAVALMQLVARLVDEDGRLAHGRVEVPADWAKASWDVPLGPEVVRGGARLLEGVDPLPPRGRSTAEWIWRQPAVTVLSTTLPVPGREKNAVRRKASARLSVRVAPGQKGEDLFAVLRDVVLTDPPGGVKVELELLQSGGSWLYEPKGPAFEAADRAYEKAWGRPLIQIGVGGSIPFVAMFGERFGDLPLILNGVMDPKTGAHGPNESMDLGVFEKAIVANVHLYEELAALDL